MKNRAEWLTFGVFVIAVLGALGFLLRRGVHGQSAALAVALLVILLLRIGIFAWNLRRQRAELDAISRSTARREHCATLGSRKRSRPPACMVTRSPVAHGPLQDSETALRILRTGDTSDESFIEDLSGTGHS